MLRQIRRSARLLLLSALVLLLLGIARNEGSAIAPDQPAENFDWGDAPAPYPTLLVDDGARHTVGIGAVLGSLVDFQESDGLPDPQALGDDNFYGDDEDGVEFYQPLGRGTLSCVNVRLIGRGYLNAWIDFNGDGVWSAGSPEQIASDWAEHDSLGADLCFNVPAGAVKGETFARFRSSADGALPPYGQGEFGEVEDYIVEIVDAKWSQPPQFNQASENPSCFWGWDEVSTYGGEQLAADDWECQDNRPVTAIQWWGSYQGWQEAVPPANAPDTFHIGLWGDVPQSETNPWSHPGDMLWEWTVAREDLDETYGGCDFHSSLPDYESCFHYTFQIPQDEWFFQGADANIYWFSIAAVYQNAPPDSNRWGWTTREKIFNDDAVRIFGPTAPTPGSPFASGEPIRDAGGNGWDMAFTVETAPLPVADFGDAPAPTYPTFFASNGAHHAIDDTYYLGAEIDDEEDGQPNGTASGDDGLNQDDEDGVTFDSPLVPGQVATTTIVASADGALDAWVDFDGQGGWAGPAERVATAYPLVAGPNQFAFKVPITATQNVTTYARFRFSIDGNLPVTGPATEGEVEDYPVQLRVPANALDLGDAPDSPYPTLLASNGARHTVNTTVRLGQQIDGEPDAQLSPVAQGDDTVALDDEDGIVWATPLLRGEEACVQVLVGPSAGRLDGWLDFNQDGDWTDAGEQIFTSLGLLPGLNTAPVTCFAVPPTATAGNSFARFRISLAGGLSPDGPAPDGEVEDYRVTIADPGAVDYGDAPEPAYPTLSASNGAVHTIVPPLILGQSVDAESDGQPSATAQGDDGAGDDEDGIQFTTALEPGSNACVDVMAPGGGVLQGWVDFDGDGSWNQPAEQLFGGGGVALVAGHSSQCFAVPGNAPAGDTFARFRLSPGGGLPPDHPGGTAPDGEVEDYQVEILTEPAAPVVTATAVLTTDVQLAWPRVAEDVNGYPILVDGYAYYTDTVPYFSPTLPAQTMTLPLPSLITATEPDTLGDPALNQYYVVRALVTDRYGHRLWSAPSSRVGEFDFALVPGSVP